MTNPPGKPQSPKIFEQYQRCVDNLEHARKHNYPANPVETYNGYIIEICEAYEALQKELEFRKKAEIPVYKEEIESLKKKLERAIGAMKSCLENEHSGSDWEPHILKQALAEIERKDA